MADRPLLALVMIVKNEARSIVQTIESVRPFVDRWLILDTGSTDGTQRLVHRAFEGIEGRLVEEPFVDFGATRNRALDLLGTQTVFSLMLSGDETLLDGLAFRRFVEAHAARGGPPHDAYYVQVQFGTTRYDSARLARTDAGWRYVGSTHEVLTKEGAAQPSLRVRDALIVHDIGGRTARSQRARWQLDQRLLEAERKARPTDTRIRFYLAQTLECLGEHRRAHAAYRRRVQMGGWREEVYESLFRMARTAHAAGKPWAEVQQRYLDAHTHSPDRAEPLFVIAMHWHELQAWPLAYLFARRGAEIPYPTHATLFVEQDVYRYKLHDLVGTAAYYVGAFDVGEAAIRQALAALPEELVAERARLQKNLAFYTQRDRPAEAR